MFDQVHAECSILSSPCRKNKLSTDGAPASAEADLNVPHSTRLISKVDHMLGLAVVALLQLTLLFWTAMKAVVNAKWWRAQMTPGSFCSNDTPSHALTFLQISQTMNERTAQHTTWHATPRLR